MKASELIKELEKAIEEHGDLEVNVFNSTGRIPIYKLDKAEFCLDIETY